MIGGYWPGTSVLHRVGAGWTYLLVLVPTVAVLVVRQWWAGLALVLLAVTLLALTRAPARLAFRLPWGLVLVLAALAAVHLWQRHPATAATVTLTILGAVLMSRVLTITTPVTELVDAIVRATRPLERLGFPAERFGLAVALVVRSVPWLLTSLRTVADAARARGLERHLKARVAPVVVAAVAHATATGEALAARGLGDPDE